MLDATVIQQFLDKHQHTIAVSDDACLKEAVTLLNQLQRSTGGANATLEQEIEKVCRGIGHNFNGILANIRGTTEITQLKMPDLPETAKQALDTILTLSDRGEYSTEQIRLYGKAFGIEQQSMSLGKELPRLINDVKMGLDINVPVSVSENGDFSVLTHIEMLESCFRIVMKNAKLALLNCDTPKIDVSLSASQVLPDAYCLTITDNGIGMSEDILAKATLPFFTTRKAADGIGLGLTIVQNFIHHQGGKLMIDSKPNHGTKVEMHFPVKPDIS